jgi:glycosyltransferase involved in cell wall biosynthesis
MNTLVTIAIPTYNRADTYLKQALLSAIGQTYRNIEIIVSDNCSADNTESVVKNFMDSRIRYFRQKENIGPYKNFNFCLEQAKGEYFLIMSDDDLIDDDFVDVCMRAVNSRNNIGIIRTGTRVIDSQGNIIGRSKNEVDGKPTEEFFRGWFKFRTSLYPCSTVFNTNKLRQIGGFGPENNLFHDDFTIAKLAADFDRVDIKDIKASFRRHNNSITNTAEVKDWCHDSSLLLTTICELVSDEYKAILRKEGSQYFAKINYKWANNIRSKTKRLFMYLFIFKFFNYQRLPPPVDNRLSRMLLSQILKFFNC